MADDLSGLYHSPAGIIYNAGSTFAKPGSRFTLCTQPSHGEGKGQILSGQATQQNIEANTAALYITASYLL